MNKAVKLFISICFIFLVPLFTTSCSNREINTSNIITDLYTEGVLSQTDIKNIAAIRVGYVALVDSEDQAVEDYQHINYNVKDPEPLSEEQENRIKIDFLNEHGNNIQNFEIIDYYGVYNDRYIMEVSYLVEGVEYTPSVEKIIVANIYLGYIGSQTMIYVWQN